VAVDCQRTGNVCSQATLRRKLQRPSAASPPPLAPCLQVRPRFVRVPDGLQPGDTFRAYAGGKRFDVRVPDGAGGGAVMQLSAAAIAAAVPSKKPRMSLESQPNLQLDEQLLDQLVGAEGATEEDLSALLAQFAQEVS